MKHLLFLLLLVTTIVIKAQSAVIGSVVDENGTPISGMYVINLRTNQNLYTDEHGSFLIPARKGDILRFVSNRFERKDLPLSAHDFDQNMIITLIPRIQDIAQVEIGFKPTGDLRYDLSHLPKDLKDEEVNYKVQQSIAMGKMKETLPRMGSAPGVRDGSKFKNASISVEPGKILSFLGLGKKQRDMIQEPPLRFSDYAPAIYHILGDQFFTDLKISSDEIQPFITYALIHETRNPNRDVIKVLKQRDWSTVREILRSFADEFLTSLKTGKEIEKKESPV